MTIELRLPAIEVCQGAGSRLYTFAVDGKEVHRFATVSRVRRNTAGDLEGYQRPEVLSHIEEIRTYLESESPMIPNAVVIAFDSRVRFEPSDQPSPMPYLRTGVLVIPIDDGDSEEQRPGFIVDGQQRLAAIRDAQIESFPICASAFITDDVQVQTEQFILVNSTKPLPKGLIYELLPGTHTTLPSMLHRRRLPSLLLQHLNTAEGSPLKGLIHTATNPGGRIKDNSILKFLENSLSDGVLYRVRQGYGSDADLGTEAMLGVLYSFWRAVRSVFADAWNEPPKRSRLTHGAGVVALGFLMDTIAERYRERGLPDERMFVKDLAAIKDVFRWTDGYWDFGPGQQRKWNEIQNTPNDVKMLANYLLAHYRNRVWSQAAPPRGPQLQLGEA